MLSGVNICQSSVYTQDQNSMTASFYPFMMIEPSNFLCEPKSQEVFSEDLALMNSFPSPPIDSSFSNLYSSFHSLISILQCKFNPKESKARKSYCKSTNFLPILLQNLLLLIQLIFLQHSGIEGSFKCSYQHYNCTDAR